MITASQLRKMQSDAEHSADNSVGSHVPQHHIYQGDTTDHYTASDSEWDAAPSSSGVMMWIDGQRRPAVKRGSGRQSSTREVT